MEGATVELTAYWAYLPLGSATSCMACKALVNALVVT